MVSSSLMTGPERIYEQTKQNHKKRETKMEESSIQYIANAKIFETYDHNNILWEFEENENLSNIIEKDYVYRYFQNRNNLINSIKSMFPNARVDNDVIEIDNSYKILLNSIERGSWKYKNYEMRLPHRFDRIKNQDKEYLNSYGYNFLEFFSKYFGIEDNIIVQEAIRQFNIDASYQNRYLFDYKPNHDIVLSSQKIPSADLLNEIYINFPSHIKCDKIYSYRNNSNNYAFHVAYIKDRNNTEYKLPVTLWRENKKNNFKEVFDILNSSFKLQLYDFTNEKINPLPILICQNERQIEEINKISDIKNRNKLTTWSGGMNCTISRTDWNFDNNENTLIIIMTSLNKESYIQSNTIYNTICKAKYKIGFCFNFQSQQNTETSYIIQNFEECERKNSFMDYAEFCEDAYKKFKLKFQKEDRIDVFTGKQLLELPPEPIEPVLSPLINKGNRIMICGSRGTGKSWLAMIIAATIASGGQLFENSDIFRSEKSHKVLYLDGEMSITEEQNRISKIFSNIENGNEGLENIKIINAIQNSELFLFKNLNDINILKKETKWADVIIIDSVFFFFPDAMGSQFEGAHTLNQFLLKNSTKNVTTIIIDHTGKTKSNHSYGTIGKEITLDLIIKLSSTKNSEIDFEITKSRNYKIDESNKKIKYKLITDDNNAKLIICENKNITDDGKNIKDNGKSSNNTKIEKIIKYYTDNPGTSIGKASIVLEIPYSTLGSNLKKLCSEGIMQKKGKHYFVKK